MVWADSTIKRIATKLNSGGRLALGGAAQASRICDRFGSA
jgi:hypothetical protein